jgi:hypothetical protein
MVAIQSAVRHEIKYILPNQAAAPVANWLRARCRPDPDHPEGLISSVYYDSHDLRLLREKINSDFAKTKVRLRWYLDSGSGAIEGPAYLEKRKSSGRAVSNTAWPPRFPPRHSQRLICRTRFWSSCSTRSALRPPGSPPIYSHSWRSDSTDDGSWNPRPAPESPSIRISAHGA